MQSKESSDANSELFKEDDDEVMYKNPYEIRLCYLISVSLEIMDQGSHVSYVLSSPRKVALRWAQHFC